MKLLSKTLVFLFSLFFVFACSSEKKLVKIFEDDFNRAEIGDNYEIQGGDWQISDGRLRCRTAKNRNLVLRSVDLPQNAVVELTMKSYSDAVDVKFNLWGDGKIHDHGDGYTFILGGWNNRVGDLQTPRTRKKEKREEKCRS